jgi:hypothetical protein
MPNTTPFYVSPTQLFTVPGTPQGGFDPSPPAFVAGSFNPGQGGRVTGATAVDLVVVAEAAPHSRITWLPEEIVSRVQAGNHSRVWVVHHTRCNK